MGIAQRCEHVRSCFSFWGPPCLDKWQRSPRLVSSISSSSTRIFLLGLGRRNKFESVDMVVRSSCSFLRLVCPPPPTVSNYTVSLLLSRQSVKPSARTAHWHFKG